MKNKQFWYIYWASLVYPLLFVGAYSWANGGDPINSMANYTVTFCLVSLFLFLGIAVFIGESVTRKERKQAADIHLVTNGISSYFTNKNV